MVRNIEKLLKIESPKGVHNLKTESIKVFPMILELDLIDLEPYTEPETTVHIELELDQLEDSEE